MINPEIDFTDLAEVRAWENLFGDPMWKKFILIQKARMAEVKETAWATFRDDKSIARGVAQIEVLETIVSFEDDFRAVLKDE